MIIRSYRPADAQAVHDICVATADIGEHASRISEEPDLCAYVFADPYLELAPELAFVLVDDHGVAGYVLGVLDSAEFYARWRREWSPRFAVSHPAPPGDQVDSTFDERLRRLLHHPEVMLPPQIDGHPSHLHVDLLARIRRQGGGRRLLEELFRALRERGSPGVHLGVSVRNTSGLAFYASLGFSELTSADPEGVVLGLHLG